MTKINVITWNCEKSSEPGGLPEWILYSKRLLDNQNIDAILLQEATTFPSGGSIKLIGAGKSGIPIFDDPSPLVYVYEYTSQKTKSWLTYFKMSSVGYSGNSTNLCIMTKYEPVVLDGPCPDINIVDGKNYSVGIIYGDYIRLRPILIGEFQIKDAAESLWLASIHMKSGQTKSLDATSLLSGLNKFILSKDNLQFLLGGDFNQEPNYTIAIINAMRGIGPETCYSGGFTYNAKKELNKTYDYFITNCAESDTSAQANFGSDHLPVLISCELDTEL